MKRDQKNPQAGLNPREQRLPLGWWPHPGVRDNGRSQKVPFLLSGKAAVSFLVVWWGQQKDPNLWARKRNKSSHRKTSTMSVDSGGQERTRARKWPA